jgi:DNA-binding transcriptional regulator GbsR (MarR family)
MVIEQHAVRDMIEESGKLFENFGLTPMQGRIVAFFTLSDKPENTFDELVKYFRASKSSISNSLNYLLNNRIIDYRTIPADRKRYFFITDYFFRYYFGRVLNDVRKLKEQVYRNVSLGSPHHPGLNQKILRWIGDANQFEDTLGNIMAKLENN